MRKKQMIFGGFNLGNYSCIRCGTSGQGRGLGSPQFSRLRGLAGRLFSSFSILLLCWFEPRESTIWLPAICFTWLIWGYFLAFLHQKSFACTRKSALWQGVLPLGLSLHPILHFFQKGVILGQKRRFFTFCRTYMVYSMLVPLLLTNIAQNLRTNQPVLARNAILHSIELWPLIKTTQRNNMTVNKCNKFRLYLAIPLIDFSWGNWWQAIQQKI